MLVFFFYLFILLKFFKRLDLQSVTASLVLIWFLTWGTIFLGKEGQEIVPENGASIENYPNTEISKAPIIYSQETQNVVQVPQIPQTEKPPLQKDIIEKPKSKQTHNIFSLAAYSGSETESEGENDNDPQAIVIPPQETQVIVDKMASYVAKNGIDFENIVKSKGDPRFVFLDPTHVFYPYYKYKLNEFGGGEPNNKKEVVKIQEKLTDEQKNPEKIIEESESKKIDENINENKIVSKSKEKKIISKQKWIKKLIKWQIIHNILILKLKKKHNDCELYLF